MPRLRLTPYAPWTPFTPLNPTGGRLTVPRLQLRCVAKLPGPQLRDAVIDTGSPYIWFGRDIWTRFAAGTDYEWLPFAANVNPPTVTSAGWSSTFRFARMLAPIRLASPGVELARAGVIVQFADGDPPTSGKGPSYFAVGLWGGLLDNTKLVITPNPQTGSVDGGLEF